MVGHSPRRVRGLLGRLRLTAPLPAVAVEYERLFAEEAKKRRVAARVESLPHENGPKASDEAWHEERLSGNFAGK